MKDLTNLEIKWLRDILYALQRYVHNEWVDVDTGKEYDEQKIFKGILKKLEEESK